MVCLWSMRLGQMHVGLAGAKLALMLFRVIRLNHCGCVPVVRSRGLELVADGWEM